MKIFVLFLLVTAGCALDQVPVASPPKFIETSNVMGIEIKRPSDDGRFETIPVKSEKFAAPVTVTRGPCPHDRYGKDCLVWFSEGEIRTEVIQEGWTVVFIEETKITVAK